MFLGVDEVKAHRNIKKSRLGTSMAQSEGAYIPETTGYVLL